MVEGYRYESQLNKNVNFTVKLQNTLSLTVNIRETNLIKPVLDI